MKAKLETETVTRLLLDNTKRQRQAPQIQLLSAITNKLRRELEKGCHQSTKD
ncbi:hypothetical protein Q5691_02510 [Microcoleus sp. w1-18aA5]|uniref:hypothetical protein n=1 Tax=unclassified Microcoleus TaxID=2642155 RepID=UPI002FD1D2DB